MSLTVFLILIGAFNLWAFVAMGYDKLAAVRDHRRISERRLLGLSLLGGVGLLTASRLFRHKTVKQPFRRQAELLCGVHIVLTAFTITLML